ncbi:MAG: STAS domain-containing protein [Bacteroidota bacterium]|nr:STAS domain-containing protein [Bacteroidota bacterium]MDP4190556.1 STAS domain-containing protein [Bacteroidota bacterium]MDP4194216.1 STAS domain-containing protein [Bacteroidota bacterium]
MTDKSKVRIFDIVNSTENEILENWLKLQISSTALRMDLLSERELRQQSAEFLSLFKEATSTGNWDINDSGWSRVLEFLDSISRSRAIRGFTPTETATFIFSLKQSLFTTLQKTSKNGTADLIQDLCDITLLIDSLGLFTTEVYLKSKEEIIVRQQTEMIELSTPVVQLWNGILALPLIGTLDSARTQVVMESLLSRIVETGSNIAIIDITGVPTVDTLVAQHLLKTVAAARLMGADCVISGIRPQIAQTIVHLGVDLSEVTTKATMADAFKHALNLTGAIVKKKQ